MPKNNPFAHGARQTEQKSDPTVRKRQGRKRRIVDVIVAVALLGVVAVAVTAVARGTRRRR